MRPRTTLQHTLVAGLAASVLAASPALARPIDRVDRFESPTSSLSGTVTPRQDLRGEHAQDAARAAAQPQDLRGEHARDAARLAQQPTNIRPESVAKPAKFVPAPENGTDDDIWLVLGIALGATGLVAGSAAAVTRRSRLRAGRAAA
jgi:hypothetical protein